VKLTTHLHPLPRLRRRGVIFLLLLYAFKVCTGTTIKGKAIPLQAWRGPEVSRRLRLPDFKTVVI
jgi:hypothetical protein